MMLKVVLCALVVVAAVESASTDSEWEQFKTTHAKVYGSKDEETKRSVTVEMFECWNNLDKRINQPMLYFPKNMLPLLFLDSRVTLNPPPDANALPIVVFYFAL